MKYKIVQPSAELKDLVSHFWLSEWDDDPIGFTYHSTANVMTELVFAFRREGRHSALAFSSTLGHTQYAAKIPAAGFSEMFGVSFHSYAVPYFFDVSPTELQGQYVHTDAILYPEGKHLGEAMSGVATWQDRIDIISNYLLLRLHKRLPAPDFIINATRQIRKKNGMVNISDLASDFSVSQKQFERNFRKHSTFNPKLYARIIRFESALWLRKKHESLTEVAHAYGYYDQSHFIHEFKQFSGFSPGEYFSLAGL